ACVPSYITLLLFSLSSVTLPDRSPLFPYTTLFRSVARGPGPGHRGRVPRLARDPADEAGGLAGGPARGLRGGADRPARPPASSRSEEHTSELQSRFDLVCRLLLEIKNIL